MNEEFKQLAEKVMILEMELKESKRNHAACLEIIQKARFASGENGCGNINDFSVYLDNLRKDADHAVKECQKYKDKNTNIRTYVKSLVKDKEKKVIEKKDLEKIYSIR